MSSTQPLDSSLSQFLTQMEGVLKPLPQHESTPEELGCLNPEIVSLEEEIARQQQALLEKIDQIRARIPS